MSDILSELIRNVKTKAYRDDVLRTIQLMSHDSPAIANAPVPKEKSGKLDKGTKSTNVYPVETIINGYAFLHIPAKVMSALNTPRVKRESDGKDIYKITKATITSYDTATKVLTIQLQ